jgi:hypothetical protein
LTAHNPWATYTGMDSKYVTRRIKLTKILSWESLFILSRLNMRQSTKPSAGVNPQGRSTKKVKLQLKGNHLEPQVVRPQCHHGDDNLE